MIFFTRKLYNGYQPGSRWQRRAMREWERRVKLYAKYLALISPLLPRGVVRLCATGLHDSVIRSVQLRGHKLTILMDTSSALSPFRGSDIELVFAGVRSGIKTHGLVGDS